MKAILYDRYGSSEVLQLQEVNRPAVGDNDVLIRIRAAGVNPYDWRFMRGTPYFMRLIIGLLKPRDGRLGAELAGEVEAVGKNVTQFKPGEAVFGRVNGSFAEYISIPETDAIAPKPVNLSFEQAASVPLAALTALQGLRDHGQIQPGQQVLINGASGGVGTFAVQLAKAFGAEVTGICSTQNLELVRSIGADKVIDYTREDFTQSGQQYELMLDMVGNHSLRDCTHILTTKGRYVVGSGPEGSGLLGPLGHLIKSLLMSPFVSQKVVSLDMKKNKADLLFLKTLIEAERITPVIDRSYPLSEAPEAIRYLEKGHARGKVVMTM
ncbi:MAG: NAD(P)-dependent alcohol dehydrogenase [Cyanobacteria bacterium P01_A01_bin.17]